MDRERFEKFAKEYRPTAAEVARRIVCDNDAAEDITQEVFLKLWNLRDTLDRYRSLQSFVVVITRNMAIDYTRRNHLPALSLDDADQIAADQSPEERMICEEQARMLDHILATLPDSQQSILRMRHIEGMETSLIARTIGSSEGAVRVALSRARHSIKELFLKGQNI